MTSPADKLRVLFVDDEQPIRTLMANELPRLGHEVTICADGEAALKTLENQTFDAAVVDLRMPGMSGWDVLDHIKQLSPDTEVIISTGHGNMDSVIQAMRSGVYDFLPKPCRIFDIATALNRVAEKRSLKNKTAALECRLHAVEGRSADLVGNSLPMQRVKKLIERVAPTNSTVLILGETGTGKELVARRIHELSSRKDHPFVPVNCGALPENLVESELFGHRRGAFTGAHAPRKGLLEVANGWTLFLDELGELDKAMQVKLLRFLESGEVRRVGENEAFEVDVRIVCATNRVLEQMVGEGTFREDLFFRVNTFEIDLPPLRARKDDINELALALISRQLRRRVEADILAPDAIEALRNHQWTGNVRELANCLEHAVILSDGDIIHAEDLPSSVKRKRPARESIGLHDLATEGVGKTLRDIEMEVIHRVLEKNQGDKPRTAAELGIALKTLYNKLNQHNSRIAG